MTNKYPSAQERYEFISDQHGGYWRHDFIDHNYLYNLYFPPEDFFTHITRQIHQLVLPLYLVQEGLIQFVLPFEQKLKAALPR